MYQQTILPPTTSLLQSVRRCSRLLRADRRWKTTGFHSALPREAMMNWVISWCFWACDWPVISACDLHCFWACLHVILCDCMYLYVPVLAQVEAEVAPVEELDMRRRAHETPDAEHEPECISLFYNVLAIEPLERHSWSMLEWHCWVLWAPRTKVPWVPMVSYFCFLKKRAGLAPLRRWTPQHHTLQECFAGDSPTFECLATPVVFKSVSQECFSSCQVLHKSFLRVSRNCVLQECPTRVFHQSVPKKFVK